MLRCRVHARHVTTGKNDRYPGCGIGVFWT